MSDEKSDDIDKNIDDAIDKKRTEIEDNFQKEVYPDFSYKHIASAKNINYISLDNDAWSAVSFRKYMRREVAPEKDSVTVSVFRKTNEDNADEYRQPLVEKSKDIEWFDDTHAKFLISGEWLYRPTSLMVVWEWMNGSSNRSRRIAKLYYRADEFMPTYADLNDDEQMLCQSVLNRFSLLRDNHYGNGMPNIAEDIQTSYSLEDVAQSMHIALSRINMTAIQTTNFIIGSEPGQHFPYVFYNLLMVETMIDLVRKLVFGYLETPDIAGNVNVAYADRRQYYNKWQAELKALQNDAKLLEQSYQRLTLNLTASSVLVGGGMFGTGTGGMFSNRMVTAISRGWQNAFYLPIDVSTYSTN